MCVILISETRRPTERQIEQAFGQNNAGAGIAWREDGLVKWEKGLELDRIQELCAEVPLPYVSHFRIPTEGGRRPGLCHPFPIEKTASLDLIGSTKGFVLFHNGHWGEWRKVLLDTLARFPNSKLPNGKWSDTRGMAWCAAYYGVNVLELINEKAIAFGPGVNDLEVAGSGWSQVDGEGLWASNRIWETKTVHGGFDNYGHMGNIRPYCGEQTCRSKDLILTTGRCKDHQRGTMTVLPAETVTPDATEGDTRAITTTEFDRVARLVKANAAFKTEQEVRADLVRQGVVPPFETVASAFGGDAPTESPFERSFRAALRLRKDHKITKDMYKKARKIYEGWLAQQPQGHPNILQERPTPRELRMITH